MYIVKMSEKYTQEKNIKNVEFLGFKAGEELEEIIKGARFTLIPSIWYGESFRPCGFPHG